MINARASNRRRNRGFEETHQTLIETCVRLISETGVEALSISALAREVGLNRTTVYYHFSSREAMLRAVSEWSAGQLAKGMDVDAPQVDRIAQITRFVLDNPELIKLWIDDFVAPGDIRERYPRWDELVAGLARSFAKDKDGAAPDSDAPHSDAPDSDAEVYAVCMLTAAIIGPRIFQNSVAPDADPESISRRFIAEHRRRLKRDGLLG